jgi:hypothetical protein
MDRQQEFQQKRTDIFNAMIACMKAINSPMTEENMSQYINGYLSLIESALNGDLSVRDEYLAVAIPPLKQHKIVTLGYSVRVLYLLNLALLGKVSVENADWYATFFADYAEKLCDIWEAS